MSDAAFAKSDLFAGIEEEALEAVAGLARREELPAGERVFRLGGEARAVYVIESGTVALTLPITVGSAERDITIDEKGAGALIGWSALVAPHRFTLGAHAVSDVVISSLDVEGLSGLFRGRPQIQATVMTNLAGVVAGRLTRWQAIAVRSAHRWIGG